MKKGLLILPVLLCAVTGLFAQAQESERTHAIMVNTKLGALFGEGGTALNIDEGIEYQFYIADGLPWGIEANFHPIWGGWGIGAKTGPMFLLSGSGLNGILIQTYVGFKGEMLTYNNTTGDFFVPMLEVDANVVYQNVMGGGFFVSVGAGLNLIVIFDAGPVLDHAAGAAFGIQAVAHIGYAF